MMSQPTWLHAAAADAHALHIVLRTPGRTGDVAGELLDEHAALLLQGAAAGSHALLLVVLVRILAGEVGRRIAG